MTRSRCNNSAQVRLGCREAPAPTQSKFRSVGITYLISISAGAQPKSLPTVQDVTDGTLYRTVLKYSIHCSCKKGGLLIRKHGIKRYNTHRVAPSLFKGVWPKVIIISGRKRR